MKPKDKPVYTYTTSRCKHCGRRYRIRWTTPDDGLCARHTVSRGR